MLCCLCILTTISIFTHVVALPFSLSHSCLFSQHILAGAEWALHNLADQFYIVTEDNSDDDVILRMLQIDIDIYGGTVVGTRKLNDSTRLQGNQALADWADQLVTDFKTKLPDGGELQGQLLSHA